MFTTRAFRGAATLFALACALLVPAARADVVTDWCERSNALVAEAKLPAPAAYRVLAIAQTAVYEAVNAITGRYAAGPLRIDGADGASVDAAVAAASGRVLAELAPAQAAAVARVRDEALSAVPDGAAKSAGSRVGERAGEAVLAMCADDGAGLPENYRPSAAPGVYVPTVVPVVPQWPRRRPWVLERADQLRPGPPPDLASGTWARDYNEIRAMGARKSARRTAEQTEIARFWEATGPAVYFPVALSVAEAPGREVTQNARLLATAAQAMDDAIIAVFDAKYHYGFWRPITAIRNGDRDGNDATEREPSWTPFIDTPMHPEYPCAHCIVSGALGAVLRAEAGAGPLPALSTTSPTAPGVVRRWTSIEDFEREVAEARICDGVHFRTSTEVGTAMGHEVGDLAVAKAPRGVQ